MSLNRTTERNRLDPVGDSSTKRFLDPAPESLFSGRNNGSQIASFANDLRLILRNFFSEFSAPENEVETVVEDVVGRFRDGGSIRSWRKTAPYRHLVLGLLLVTFFDESDSADEVIEFTKKFSITWREYLLAKSWEQLHQKEIKTGRPYYSVLQCRYDKPWLTNRGLLQELSGTFDSSPTKQAFRVFLHRSEQHFARGVVSAVSRTIHLPGPRAIRSELHTLDLIQFDQP